MYAAERGVYGAGRAVGDAVASRTVFLRHPWVLQLLVVRPPLTPHRLANLQETLPLVDQDDFPMIARYIADGSDEDDYGRNFALSLACVIDGIGIRLGI